MKMWLIGIHFLNKEPHAWGLEMPPHRGLNWPHVCGTIRGHSPSTGNTGSPFAKWQSPPSEFVFCFSPGFP